MGILMIVLATLSLLLAILWSFLVVWANGMSDSPSGPFQGGGSLIAAWVVTGTLFLAWAVG